VARYFVPATSVQFIRDPADSPWNLPGWGVWYAPQRPDAFLTSLRAIQGHAAYLVHATADCTWRPTGSARLARVRWQADSFTLVGFALDERAPPTFERFFAGAGGLIGNPVYRLSVDGKWQRLTHPATTPMRSGEAYWIYCAGNTDYQGPLDVHLPGIGALDFDRDQGALEIRVRNTSTEPASFTLERASDSGAPPLVRLERDAGTLRTSYPDLAELTAFPALQPGQIEIIRLQVRREAMTSAQQSGLLRLTSSLGVRFDIPVQARRTDLTVQP
jgi:hypothetical protein